MSEEQGIDLDQSRPARGGDASKQRLLDAAVELFARDGFRGSSVRDLARVAEMSLAGVYHHFKSKDDILFEIQKDAFEQLMEPIRQLDRSTPALERLELFVRNHIEFFSRQQTKMRLLSHELEALPGPRGTEINLLRTRYYRICLEAVTDQLADSGRDDLDPRVATMALFGMINWIYRWYPRTSDPAPPELARTMLDLFLHGLGGQPRAGKGDEK